jgi:hypothetical protein
MESWMSQDLVRANEEVLKIRTRYAHHRAELEAERRAARAARPRRSLTAALRLRLSVLRSWRTRSLRGQPASDA